MPTQFVTGASLRADPNFPYIAHVPIDRLRLDPKDLPPQRKKPDGTPICLAGDHPVTGDALLCAACRKASANESQKRRRRRLTTDVAVSKSVLARIHEEVDALSPLITDLSTAYNYGGDLREETHRTMLAFKKLQREIRTLLPDPRDDQEG